MTCAAVTRNGCPAGVFQFMIVTTKPGRVTTIVPPPFEIVSMPFRLMACVPLAPWSTVEDVLFVNNVVRHVGSAINMLGRDDNYPSQQTRRILIRDNLFVDVGGRWGDRALLGRR